MTGAAAPQEPASPTPSVAVARLRAARGSLPGFGLSLGMTLAFEFSARLGLLPPAEAERACRHLGKVGLPTHISDVPGGVPGVDGLMHLMAQDKKVKRGRLTFILVRGVGKAYVAADVDAAEVRAFLADKLAR